MQTRCPACHTLYRIDDDVLQRAGGQARCFRCDTVFEAQPAEEEPDLPVGDLALHAEDPLDLGDEQLPELDAAVTDLDDLGSLPEIPDDDAFGVDSEFEPDSLSEVPPAKAEESPDLGDEQLSELDAAVSDLDDLESLPELPDDAFGVDSELEPDSLSEEPPAKAAEPAEDATDLREFPKQRVPSIAMADDLREGLPFDMPEDLPPLEAAAEEAPTIEQSLEAPPPPLPSLWPAVGVVLLILLALGQLAWQLRQPILATPAGRGLAEGVCSLVGCQLPPRRAPSRYLVLERNVGPLPGREGVLALHLSFRNTAEFPQPLPDIQLSLYDSEEKLMARRRLHPDEYLFPAPPSDTLVESGGLLQVDLKLEDPGRRATGFKLEFL